MTGSRTGRRSVSWVAQRESEGNDLMADESPYIDYENLPVPSEGIIATLFITVRKVAQSRDFYSRASWAGR